MIIEGNGFKYFFNNEEKTREEIEELSKYATNITVGNGVVNYFSPKKKINKLSDLIGAYDFKLPVSGTIYDIDSKRDLKILEFLGFSAHKKNKTEELLEEVNKHQEQNGGRDVNMEFPFDAVLTPTREEKEQDVIKAWEREDTKKYIDSLNSKIGAKETENKIDYGELDFDYIDGMALRMTKNLAKYPPKNWQKKIEIKELAKSAMRHARKILQEIDGDEETLQDHAIALGNNGMMINYQIKLNKDLEVSK